MRKVLAVMLTNIFNQIKLIFKWCMGIFHGFRLVCIIWTTNLIYLYFLWTFNTYNSLYFLHIFALFLSLLIYRHFIYLLNLIVSIFILITNLMNVIRFNLLLLLLLSFFLKIYRDMTRIRYFFRLRHLLWAIFNQIILLNGNF